MPRDEKSIECDDKGRIDPTRDEAASGILQARCRHITSEKYINVETTRYCRLGESAKTLDTDLRMSIILSRDVLTGGRLPAFKLHVYWDSRNGLRV